MPGPRGPNNRRKDRTTDEERVHQVVRDELLRLLGDPPAEIAEALMALVNRELSAETDRALNLLAIATVPGHTCPSSGPRTETR